MQTKFFKEVKLLLEYADVNITRKSLPEKQQTATSKNSLVSSAQNEQPLNFLDSLDDNSRQLLACYVDDRSLEQLAELGPDWNAIGIPETFRIVDNFSSYILKWAEPIARTFLNLDKNANLYDTPKKRVLIYNICKLYEKCNREFYHYDDEILFIYNELFLLAEKAKLNSPSKVLKDIYVQIEQEGLVARKRYKNYKDTLLSYLNGTSDINSLIKAGINIHALYLRDIGHFMRQRFSNNSDYETSARLPIAIAQNHNLTYLNYSYCFEPWGGSFSKIFEDKNCNISYLSLRDGLGTAETGVTRAATILEIPNNKIKSLNFLQCNFFSKEDGRNEKFLNALVNENCEITNLILPDLLLTDKKLMKNYAKTIAKVRLGGRHIEVMFESIDRSLKIDNSEINKKFSDEVEKQFQLLKGNDVVDHDHSLTL